MVRIIHLVLSGFMFHRFPKTSSTTLTSKGKKRKASTMDKFVVTTSKEEKISIDEQIARMVFATNSAFRVVEHPEFVKLVEILRPGYKPPSRFAVSDKLLNEVHEKEMNICSETLRGKTVCMSLDGWSNVHNDPIVCVSITTPEGETYLADTVDTSGHPHTSDYLTEVAKESITKIENTFNCKIGSLVTDNASNVSKMRSELNIIYPTIFTYGCSAHIFNLLSQDLQIPDIKQHVVQITKYFRNNHFAAAKYKEAKGTKLILPQEVRWNSLADCLEVYISNWSTLLKICEDHRDKIDTNIISKVANVSIKRNAEDLLSIMKPISVALDCVQADTCTISQAVDI